jgi:hypothetical protein
VSLLMHANASAGVLAPEASKASRPHFLTRSWFLQTIAVGNRVLSGFDPQCPVLKS